MPILTVSPIIQHVFAYHTISNINDSIRNMYSNVCDSSGIVHDTGARLTPPTIHELVVTEDPKLDVCFMGVIVTVCFRTSGCAIPRRYFLHVSVGVIETPMLKMDGVVAPNNSGDKVSTQLVWIANGARIFPISDFIPHLDHGGLKHFSTYIRVTIITLTLTVRTLRLTIAPIIATLLVISLALLSLAGDRFVAPLIL